MHVENPRGANCTKNYLCLYKGTDTQRYCNVSYGHPVVAVQVRGSRVVVSDESKSVCAND